MMRKILKMLETEYERPVDVEFAVRSPGEGVWKVNLLQCRPLQVAASEQVEIPEGIDDELLFDVRRTSMRRSKKESLDCIVWVDPQAYYEHPYTKKPDVGRMISCINQYYEEEDKKLMLLVLAGSELHPRNWECRLSMPISASSLPYVKWHTVRRATGRSFPMEAICSRTWWRRTFITGQLTRTAKPDCISRNY